MVSFRNLEIGPEAPVSDWGVEGILAAIDRGDLAEWSRIAQAVRENPGGPSAADLEEALDLAEDHGVVAVLRTILQQSRSSDAERFAPRFRVWVAASGLSRTQLAERIGTSRSRLSTYENGKVIPSAATAAKVRSLAARRRAHLV